MNAYHRNKNGRPALSAGRPKVELIATRAIGSIPKINRPIAPRGYAPVDWPKCVRTASGNRELIVELADWRGWSANYISERLLEDEGIGYGKFYGEWGWCFPVIAKGKVVAVHCRLAKT